MPDDGKIWDSEAQELFEERFSYRDSRLEAADIPVKMTVSELKQGTEAAEEAGEYLYEPEEPEEIIPQFVRPEEEKLQGAARGTAYHRFFQRLDYTKCEKKSQISEQIRSLTEQKKLTPEEANSLWLNDLFKFVQSPLGQRMKRASLAGKLFREQPFVMEIRADEADSSWDSEETLLIQGMIDAYFEEEDELVLVDYKTDRVEKPEELVEKYKKQLNYYAEALERLTGKKVREQFIYSVRLSMEICV